jgi:hypothetical protein
MRGHIKKRLINIVKYTIGFFFIGILNPQGDFIG